MIASASAAGRIPLSTSRMGLDDVAAAGGGAFSPLSLTPALWIDPSDAATVTISGSSGAYIGPTGLVNIATAGNGASAPSIAAYGITAELELVLRISMVDWSPASTQVPIGRRAGTSGYAIEIRSTGQISLITDAVTTLSSSAAPFTDGTAYWLKATYKDSTDEVKFWYAADQATEPGAWTQIGTTVTNTSTLASSGGTSLFVGSYDGTNGPCNGTVMRAIVRNGIGGTTVFDADFVAATDYVSSFTESSSNAATVTVTSSTSGALVSQINDKSGGGRHLTQATAAKMPNYVNVGGINWLYFDGGNKSLAVGGGVQVQPHTVFMPVRLASTASQVMWDTGPNNASYVNGTWNYYAGGVAIGAVQDTSLHLLTYVVNGASSAIRLDGASTTKDPGTLPTGGTWSIGRDGSSNIVAGGRIGETIFVLSIVSGVPLTNCEAYLRTKWGTP